MEFRFRTRASHADGFNEGANPAVEDPDIHVGRPEMFSFLTIISFGLELPA